jgi:hypothetical protein
MVDLNALSAILSARNGVWTLVVLFFIGLWRGYSGLPAVMAQWIARRQAIAAEKDAEWKRLRDEVERYSQQRDEADQRFTQFRDEQLLENAECRRQLHEALGRLAQVEGFMMGQGKARQDAAAIVAVERLTDRNGEKDEGGK